MRWLLLLSVTAAAQDQTPPACWSDLVKPVYPPLARQARVEGSVQLKFRVNAEGHVADLEAEGHPLLKPMIEDGVRLSRFDAAECGGKQFEVTYQFAIGPEGKAADTLSFRPPDGFLLVGYPSAIWSEVYLRPNRPHWLKRLFRRR